LLDPFSDAIFEDPTEMYSILTLNSSGMLHHILARKRSDD
jgi:hypothetical protein